MIRRFLVFSAVAVLAGCSSLKSCDAGFAKKDVLARCNEACVEILSNGQIKGTGAFVSTDGLVLTASHLFINDDVKVEVISRKQGRLQARLLRRSRVADVALVKVDKPGAVFPALPIAQDRPEQGENVGCFGAALWNPIMLLGGKVANPSANYCEYPSSNGYMRCYFVSAAIPGLASGGPWINSQGELIGVQAGHLLDQGKDAGVAMVARLDDINALMKAKGSIHSSGIGAWIWPLWTTDKALVDGFPQGTQGLLVNSLHKNSPLQKAGIKQYELIVSCNGVKTDRRGDLLKLVKAAKPGSTVSLEVMDRDGKARKVEVALADTEPGRL